MDIYEEYIENVIQMADQAIDNGLYDEAKKWFEKGLYEEPGYAKLHYRLAYLFQYNLFDNAGAEQHYWLAIKFKPDYRYAYENLARLYLENEKYDGLENLMRKAIRVEGFNKTFAYENLGKVAEAQGQFKKAIAQYRKGMMQALDNYDVDDLKDHIKRNKYKRLKKRWKLWQREN
ncbi:MAG: hypothetical protein HWE21_13415 [Cytophagia bacterium]|nr:hypothetical protein [Cytophagia bacterium]NVK85317.1 hypothetical protein [Cytophagia bacterium]